MNRCKEEIEDRDSLAAFPASCVKDRPPENQRCSKKAQMLHGVNDSTSHTRVIQSRCVPYPDRGAMKQECSKRRNAERECTTNWSPCRGGQSPHHRHDGPTKHEERCRDRHQQ